MGNNTQSQSVTAEQESYSFTHPQFKKGHFLQKEGQAPTIITEIPIDSQKMYVEWSERVKSNPGLGVQGALNPIGHQFIKEGACGSSGVVKITFESFPFTLKDEINNRIQLGYQKFKECELWYLLATLADVGEKFHNVGQKVGDIRPINIFINEDGETKTSTIYSWPEQMTNYAKTFLTKAKTYLAPEEVRDIEVGRNQSIAEVGIAEAFSIGLTVIDATLLCFNQELYQKEGHFDFPALKVVKEKLKNQTEYQNSLKYVLLGLTEESFENRLSVMELKQWMEPYLRYILELQPFSCENFPQKVQRIIEQLGAKQEKSGMKLLSTLSPKQQQRTHSVKDKDIKFTFGKNFSSRATTLLRSSDTNPVFKATTPNQYGYRQGVVVYPTEKVSASGSMTPVKTYVRPSRASRYQVEPIRPPQNEYYQGTNLISSRRANQVASPTKGIVEKRINFVYESKSNRGSIGSQQQYLVHPYHRNSQSIEQVLHSPQHRLESQLSSREYFGTTSSINVQQKVRESSISSAHNRGRRSSSIKSIDDKITLSRQVFHE